MHEMFGTTWISARPLQPVARVGKRLQELSMHHAASFVVILAASIAVGCSGPDGEVPAAQSDDAALGAPADASSAPATQDGGVPPADAAPGPSKQPVQMTWVTVPTQAVTPGLVADPDPVKIQDDGLNSSVVLRLTRNGQPVVGEDVAWASDDATSGIQALTTRSDNEGLVRAWYFAGKQATQQIIARHVGTSQLLTTSVARIPSVSPTVGRYAATYYRAPAGQYSAYSVSLIPKTAPERTYYQVSSMWRTDGSIALYGGLQMTDCAALVGASSAVVAACDASKGAYRGRTALFSLWDWTSPSGTLTPIFVSAPVATSCGQFGGEGTGLQCFAPLSWDVGEEWRWTLQLLAGAPFNHQRVRVVLANAARGITQEIATVDVAGALDIANVSAFNENWGGAPASSCLDVAFRSMQIVSMGFWNGTQWIKPASGQAMGGLYNDTMTRCQNYAFNAEAGGLTIASGGVGTWINLADALVLDPVTQKRVFTPDQLLWQWQALNVSTLGVPPNGP